MWHLHSQANPGSGGMAQPAISLSLVIGSGPWRVCVTVNFAFLEPMPFFNSSHSSPSPTVSTGLFPVSIQVGPRVRSVPKGLTVAAGFSNPGHCIPLLQCTVLLSWDACLLEGAYPRGEENGAFTSANQTGGNQNGEAQGVACLKSLDPVLQSGELFADGCSSALSLFR